MIASTLVTMSVTVCFTAANVAIASLQLSCLAYRGQWSRLQRSSPGSRAQPSRVCVDAIRVLYGHLATFAQSALWNTPHAYKYLQSVRRLPVAAIERLLGWADPDAGLYRQWYAGIDAGQRAAAEWAGLPAAHHNRLTGHGAMFAGGHQGKIVFPYLDDAGAVVDLRTRSISPKDTAGGKPVRYTSPRGPWLIVESTYLMALICYRRLGRWCSQKASSKRLQPIFWLRWVVWACVV